MVWEGEGTPEVSPLSRKVLYSARMLANGMGGYDWSALPIACALYEVENVEELIEGLLVCKSWRKPDDDEGGSRSEE